MHNMYQEHAFSLLENRSIKSYNDFIFFADFPLSTAPCLSAVPYGGWYYPCMFEERGKHQRRKRDIHWITHLDISWCIRFKLWISAWILKSGRSKSAVWDSGETGCACFAKKTRPILHLYITCFHHVFIGSIRRNTNARIIRLVLHLYVICFWHVFICSICRII